MKTKFWLIQVNTRSDTEISLSSAEAVFEVKKWMVAIWAPTNKGEACDHDQHDEVNEPLRKREGRYNKITNSPHNFGEGEAKSGGNSVKLI